MTHYGQGNSGPAREIWHDGDAVSLWTDEDGWLQGHIAPARRAPHAFETEWVWVEWDDGEGTYQDPNGLEAGGKGKIEPLDY